MNTQSRIPISTTARFFNDALNELDDKRILDIKPLIPPQILVEDFPLSLKAAATILEGRRGADAIIKGDDDRILVIVGPCSIHDVKAAHEYAALLKNMRIKLKMIYTLLCVFILKSQEPLLAGRD